MYIQFQTLIISILITAILDARKHDGIYRVCTHVPGTRRQIMQLLRLLLERIHYSP